MYSIIIINIFFTIFIKNLFFIGLVLTIVISLFSDSGKSIMSYVSFYI